MKADGILTVECPVCHDAQRTVGTLNQFLGRTDCEVVAYGKIAGTELPEDFVVERVTIECECCNDEGIVFSAQAQELLARMTAEQLAKLGVLQAETLAAANDQLADLFDPTDCDRAEEN